MDHIYFEIQYGGKERDLNCEPEENEIFNILCSMFEEIGRNPEQLDFVRLSDNYVSAKYGESDIARFHWGPRSKWIKFPIYDRPKDRRKITSPEDVRQYSDVFKDAVESIEKYM